MDLVDELCARQCGVVSRRQLLDLTLRPHDIARLLRRRDLAPMMRGVYVNHTGRPTWIQRAWGAVLYAWPAALAGASAVRLVEQDRLDALDDDMIEIAVAGDREVVAPTGVRVVRRTHLDQRVHDGLQPPRERYEVAVLELAITADELGSVAVLARACATRRTTADRLLRELASRPRVSGRRWLHDVLRDIADGTHSVLEHGYLVRVERAHRLPKARRQLVSKSEGTMVYRDVDDDRMVVELDGRIYHESFDQRDADLDRDLDVLVGDRPTARLGWGQVFGRPCRTAAKVARILQNHGWEGEPTPCSDACVLHSASAGAI